MSILPFSDETKTVLEVENLNLYYGQNLALKQVSLAIPKNKVTAFIGPFGVWQVYPAPLF